MDNVQKNLSTLKFLAKCHPKIRKAILKYSDNDLIIAISECVLNCLKGNIEVKSDVTEELLKYKKTHIKVNDQIINLKDSSYIIIEVI